MPHVDRDQVEPLLKTLEAGLPVMPDPHARCHRGICEQVDCAHCTRIATTRGAFYTLKQLLLPHA